MSRAAGRKANQCFAAGLVQTVGALMGCRPGLCAKLQPAYLTVVKRAGLAESELHGSSLGVGPLYFRLLFVFKSLFKIAWFFQCGVTYMVLKLLSNHARFVTQAAHVFYAYNQPVRGRMCAAVIRSQQSRCGWFLPVLRT